MKTAEMYLEEAQIAFNKLAEAKQVLEAMGIDVDIDITTQSCCTPVSARGVVEDFSNRGLVKIISCHNCIDMKECCCTY